MVEIRPVIADILLSLLMMMLLLLLLIPETYLGILVKIGSVSAGILLTLSLCGWVVIVVFKVVFVSKLTQVM